MERTAWIALCAWLIVGADTPAQAVTELDFSARQVVLTSAGAPGETFELALGPCSRLPDSRPSCPISIALRSKGQVLSEQLLEPSFEAGAGSHQVQALENGALISQSGAAEGSAELTLAAQSMALAPKAQALLVRIGRGSPEHVYTGYRLLLARGGQLRVAWHYDPPHTPAIEMTATPRKRGAGPYEELLKVHTDRHPVSGDYPEDGEPARPVWWQASVLRWDDPTKSVAEVPLGQTDIPVYAAIAGSYSDFADAKRAYDSAPPSLLVLDTNQFSRLSPNLFILAEVFFDEHEAKQATESLKEKFPHAYFKRAR